MPNVILLKDQTAIIHGCSANYTTSLRHSDRWELRVTDLRALAVGKHDDITFLPDVPGAARLVVSGRLTRQRE